MITETIVAQEDIASAALPPPNAADAESEKDTNFANGKDRDGKPNTPPPIPEEELKLKIEAIAVEILAGKFKFKDVTCHLRLKELKEQYLKLGVTLGSLYQSLKALLPELDTEPISALRVADYISEIDGVSLFHDSLGFAYITTPNNGNLKLSTRESTRWILTTLDEAKEDMPGTQAIKDAQAILDARAFSKGAVIEASLRVAWHKGEIFIDVGDEGFSAIHVTANDWQLITHSGLPQEVKFVRAPGLMASPVPVRGGSLDEYKSLVNLEGDGFSLFKIFLVTSFSKGPYPIGNAEGEPGSGKTWAMWVARQSVDPSSVPVVNAPGDKRNLAIACTNSYLITGDNQSKISQEMSDAHCGVSTGSGFRTRMLFADTTEILLAMSRPQFFTGIGDYGRQPDYLSRSFFWRFKKPKEGDEKEIAEMTAEFENKCPRLFGALLDALVIGLRQFPTIKTKGGFRLADAIKFARAAAVGIGLTDEEVIRICKANERGALLAAIESDTFAIALIEFLKGRTDDATSFQKYTGSFADLLKELLPKEKAPPKDWPISPRAVRASLDRFRHPLELAGVTWERCKRKDKKASRLLTFSYSETKSNENDMADMAEDNQDAPF